MTASLSNSQNGPLGYNVDGYVYPQFIGYALRAPTTQDIYPPGTQWQDNSVNPPVIYITTGAGIWNEGSIPSDLTLNNLTVINIANFPSGINLNPTESGTVASPTTINNRSGQVTFSGVSIAAGASQTFVINNNTAHTATMWSMWGATAGAALTIQSITTVDGVSDTIVVTNGTGATTSTANITFTFFNMSTPSG